MNPAEIIELILRRHASCDEDKSEKDLALQIVEALEERGWIYVRMDNRP